MIDSRLKNKKRILTIILCFIMALWSRAWAEDTPGHAPSMHQEHTMNHGSPMDDDSAATEQAEPMKGHDHSMHLQHTMDDGTAMDDDSAATEQAEPMKGHDHSMHLQHTMDDGTAMDDDSAATEQAIRDLLSTGVDEKSGQIIALDAVFRDENGNRVRLGDLVDKPTVILPIFFYCPVVCPLLLSNLAHAVGDVTFDPGQDFRVVALSFNDEETPDVARDAKGGYMEILPESFPDSAWTFLTGDEANILAFTDSIGYRFKKTAPSTFVHPNAMVIVSGEGKIIRYIYGSTYLGSDIGMGIAEAMKGTPGISIKRIISFCFNYDPEGRRYLVIFFKLIALVTVVSLVLFFILFLRKSDRNDKESTDPPGQDDSDSQTSTRNKT